MCPVTLTVGSEQIFASWSVERYNFWRLKDRFDEHRRTLDNLNTKSNPTTVGEHILSSLQNISNNMQLIPMEKIFSNRDSIRKDQGSLLNFKRQDNWSQPSKYPQRNILDFILLFPVSSVIFSVTLLVFGFKLVVTTIFITFFPSIQGSKLSFFECLLLATLTYKKVARDTILVAIVFFFNFFFHFSDTHWAILIKEGNCWPCWAKVRVLSAVCRLQLKVADHCFYHKQPKPLPEGKP